MSTAAMKELICWNKEARTRPKIRGAVNSFIPTLHVLHWKRVHQYTQRSRFNYACRLTQLGRAGVVEPGQIG